MMKKRLKRLMVPLLRPIMRRVDARLDRIVSESFRVHFMPLDATLQRLESSIAASAKSAEVLAFDVDLLFENLVRETARLQAQVATLQASIDCEAHPEDGTLNFVGNDELDWGDPDFQTKVG